MTSIHTFPHSPEYLCSDHGKQQETRPSKTHEAINRQDDMYLLFQAMYLLILFLIRWQESVSQLTNLIFVTHFGLKAN